MNKPKFDHTELILRLNKGDKYAFTTLYQLYSKRFYISIFKIVKDNDVADELLQALFMKIWEKHESIDASKSFEAFLHTIARNLIYDHFRKVAQQQRLVKALLHQEAQAPLHNDESSTEKAEAATLLQAALNQLSPQRRKVFYLCKIEGRSYHEVSSLLGISVATVNTHMTKSKLLIKAFLLINRYRILILTNFLLSLFNNN